MSDSQGDKLNASARGAMELGKQALSTATTGARAGARLAVGTLFAGANVLLDLGVRVSKRLPMADGNGESVELEMPDGSVTNVVVDRAETGARAPLGWWLPSGAEPTFGDAAIQAALRDVTRAIYLVRSGDMTGVATGGRAVLGADAVAAGESYPLVGFAPALEPEALGDPAFCAAHGLKYAYVAGAMANGIASEAIVIAMGNAGMMGMFGAAGLPIDRVSQAVDRIQSALGDRPYGFNLIHSPNEPALESGCVELYLRRGVRRVSASAYLDLTLPLVKYRLTGIARDIEGRVVCRNQVIGKVSRAEVARKFLSPAPDAMVRKLVESGDLTEAQAQMAREVPIADDLTIEADSGGHTDNRPALTLFPGMVALRDGIQAEHGYAIAPRLGLAGGIATPDSVAAAFSMGAAYVLTGSVNQACVEAGTSDVVRQMLAEAGQADVIMAPAADMFEMGVKLQVLKRGTMFPMRARKLYDWYRAHDSLDALPAAARTSLERDYLRATVDEAWESTKRFFAERDPSQIARAETDPKHKMALVFRSYLGLSSVWANSGDASRKVDYQVWCGPAMGAFNEWTAGTFLAEPRNRKVVTVGRNLMLGAAVRMRANMLRAQGAILSPAAERFEPVNVEN
ncbi:MAG TPA: PfaD family polyunsaturated fatty acid/polyketide biosynthesis protein [Phycisphaerae bacterium]|nr:PfaD family polyunsaturated fatty acid/polyketide biosynthesis protein [Phycisphaerae bacterium]HRW54626.1 PfaD family polyunsaturated fatty acid/polyketide biosynthesis protein [Phycisphaerae bacterium]